MVTERETIVGGCDICGGHVLSDGFSLHTEMCGVVQELIAKVKALEERCADIEDAHSRRWEP